MTTSDDDRIAYLAGEPVDSLNPEERAELEELRVMLKAPATWEEPDPGLEDRVVAAIAQEARALPERRRAPGRRFRLRLGLRRPVYALGALAAAAAAAVVIAVAVNNAGPSPLRFAMVLYGTPLAPGAHGSGTLTKTNSGWRIELSAKGLSRRANGLYYEAWLKNAAGVLVPVGTFNDATHITLWAGVPPTSFPTLTVTQQRVGSEVSSGKRVFVGKIRTTR